MTNEILPEGRYLVCRYLDAQRGEETWNVYFEDGRVEFSDGQEWSLVCRFTEEQVRRAKEAIRASGLLTATDLTAEGVYDTAAVMYAWSLGDEQGSVTNWVYPAYIHPAFDALEIELDELEAEAGAYWSLEEG
jgi:hypothetical protein